MTEDEFKILTLEYYRQGFIDATEMLQISIKTLSDKIDNLKSKKKQ